MFLFLNRIYLGCFSLYIQISFLVALVLAFNSYVFSFHSVKFLQFVNNWLNAAEVPFENILYLGGPNIASEIYNKEYANARICGADKWRKPLAKFLRQPHFIVWDNSDLITHEVMGGLKNVYAIGAGNCVFSYLTGLFLFHVLLPLKAYLL
jgi:hypothetical protein